MSGSIPAYESGLGPRRMSGVALAFLAVSVGFPAAAQIAMPTPALDRFLAAERQPSESGVMTLATEDMVGRCRRAARADAAQLAGLLDARPPYLTGLEFELEQVIANVNLLGGVSERLAGRRDEKNREIARILARPQPRSAADEAQLVQLTGERDSIARQFAEAQSAQNAARAKNTALRVAIGEANRIQDGVNTCIQQRRVQLAGGGGQVFAGGPTIPAPAPAPARLADWSGQVSGGWAGSCLYDGRQVASPSGGFSLSFDGRGKITGSFVQGAAATIRGLVMDTGALLASGSIVMDGAELGLNLSGAVRRAPSGGIAAAGVFNANDGKGLACAGQWQG